jgi:hypothetical protein
MQLLSIDISRAFLVSTLRRPRFAADGNRNAFGYPTC